jgi:hypothetical protein
VAVVVGAHEALQACRVVVAVVQVVIVQMLVVNQVVVVQVLNLRSQ